MLPVWVAKGIKGTKKETRNEVKEKKKKNGDGLFDP